MDLKSLPFFLHNDNIRTIFQDVVACLWDDVEAYLVSGAIRNSLVYKLLGEELPWRDYDVVVVQWQEEFVQRLQNKGFSFTDGHLKGMSHGAILRRPKFPNPKKMIDYVYLDLIFSSKSSFIQRNMESPNFTLNGAALSLGEIFAADRYEKLIVLPTTIADIQNKQIRVNNAGGSTNIYACLRFMHLGFAPPLQEEVQALLQSWREITKGRFERNIKKLTDYVWGMDRARELARELGVWEDLFVRPGDSLSSWA